MYGLITSVLQARILIICQEHASFHRLPAELDEFQELFLFLINTIMCVL